MGGDGIGDFVEEHFSIVAPELAGAMAGSIDSDAKARSGIGEVGGGVPRAAGKRREDGERRRASAFGPFLFHSRKTRSEQLRGPCAAVKRFRRLPGHRFTTIATFLPDFAVETDGSLAVAFLPAFRLAALAVNEQYG